VRRLLAQRADELQRLEHLVVERDREREQVRLAREHHVDEEVLVGLDQRVARVLAVLQQVVDVVQLVLGVQQRRRGIEEAHHR
jgi:hypothetical protein